MRRPTAAALAALALVLACGTSGTEVPPAADRIGWVSSAAQIANGPAPDVDLVGACGSDTATYLTELLDTSPLNARVQREWGDCVEGGRQVMVSGRVVTTHLGPTDEPMSHPFGDDLSMNVELDAPFLPFAKKLGAVKGEESATQLHVEISSGFLPHVPRPANPATGQHFRDAADWNLDRASFQPGFDEPAVGDRVLVMGRWIIDCGHANFSSELHAMSFLAWAHVDGGKTTVRFFYNPYRDTEVFKSAGSQVLGAVDDTARLSGAETFPRYFIHQILGLDDGSVDRLRSLELIDATHASPVDWEVCLPAAGPLALRYDVVARSGANVALTPDPARGCVRVRSTLDAYVPAPAVVRRCVMPWPYLDGIVSGTVGHPVDLRALIAKYVASADGKARLSLDPEAACGDALAGPPVSAAPSGQDVRVDDTQPFPFYGIITLEPGVRL